VPAAGPPVETICWPKTTKYQDVGRNSFVRPIYVGSYTAGHVYPRMFVTCSPRRGNRGDKPQCLRGWFMARHVSPRTCLWLPSALRDKEGESLCACCWGQRTRLWTGGRRSGSRKPVVGRMRAEGTQTPPPSSTPRLGDLVPLVRSLCDCCCFGTRLAWLVYGSCMSLPEHVCGCPPRFGTRKGRAALLRDKARVVGLWLLHVSPRTCLWLPSALRDKEGESSTASGQGSRGWFMALACLSPNMFVAALRASGQGRGEQRCFGTRLAWLVYGSTCVSPHTFVAALRASGQGRGRPLCLLLGTTDKAVDRRQTLRIAEAGRRTNAGRGGPNPPSV